MPNPRRAKIYLETHATWTELEGAVRSLVVATLRNDAAAAERVRLAAHELLDRHFDLKIEGIAAIRIDIENQMRRL